MKPQQAQRPTARTLGCRRSGTGSSQRHDVQREPLAPRRAWWISVERAHLAGAYDLVLVQEEDGDPGGVDEFVDLRPVGALRLG